MMPLSVLSEDEVERFTNDLISLFEKHHLAILWETDHLVRILPNTHVDYLGRGTLPDYGEQELVIPVCSEVKLDDLVNLENDDDGLQKPEE